MNKKFTKEQLKNIKITINSLRSNGMSDQEIYNELRSQSDEERKIYNLVTTTATEESRNKYHILNNILITLLATSFLSRFLFTLDLYLSGKTNLFFGLILVLLLTCFITFFMMEVIKYNGYIYKTLGFIFVSDCLRYLGYILKHIAHVGKIGFLLDDIFSMLISVFGAIVSFYIAKKLFPNYKIFKSKDSYGEYIITEE